MNVLVILYIIFDIFHTLTRLWAIRSEVRFLAGTRELSLLEKSRLPPWVKPPGREADHSTPSSAEVKN
jgi:hypothetical protein